MGRSVAVGILAIALFLPRIPPKATGELRQTITGERQAAVEYGFSCPEGFISKKSAAAVPELSAAIKDGSAGVVIPVG